MSDLAVYNSFLEKKIRLDAETGFPCRPDEVSPVLKPHQRDMVAWAVRGGRRALFSAFGLGKTMMQIEAQANVAARELRKSVEPKAFPLFGAQGRLMYHSDTGLIFMNPDDRTPLEQVQENKPTPVIH